MRTGLSQEALDYLNWSSEMDRKIRFTEEFEIENFPTQKISDFVLQSQEDEAFKELESRLK
jgi:hypothetical protein